MKLLPIIAGDMIHAVNNAKLFWFSRKWNSALWQILETNTEYKSFVVNINTVQISGWEYASDAKEAELEALEFNSRATIIRTNKADIKACLQFIQQHGRVAE